MLPFLCTCEEVMTFSMELNSRLKASASKSSHLASIAYT